MEFTRGNLLGQARLTDTSQTLLLAAGAKTEVSLVMAAPDSASELTVFHVPSGATLGAEHRILYRYAVTQDFQGPILALQAAGGGIHMEVGDTLQAVMDVGTGMTVSVYGVTVTLSPQR